MSESQARVPWEIKYGEVTDNPNIIRCKLCQTNLLFSEFTKHLYITHKISELTDHPNREFLEKNFIIDLNLSTGRCRICGTLICYNLHGIYLLQNHYEIFHSDNSDLFKTVVKAENGKDILSNFILKNKKAVCRSCELQINIEHLDVLTADALTELVNHHFSHDRYEDNFFIFDKRSGNRFCFTCFFFFNNFIIIPYQTNYDWNQFSIKIVNYC